jgi:uncharacterized SAM-binding protein YcdF (DUF218 family)
VARDVTRLLGAAILGGVLAIGYTTYRIWDLGGRDDARPADAIVVLGAAQYDGRPSPVFEARLRHAVDLYHAGIAPVFVVTGGKLPGDRTTEAAAARTYALANGVPDRAILVEDAGRTTLESLRSVAGLLREHDLTTAVFVSDRTHMLRVLRIATDIGVDAYGSPTTTSPIEGTWARRLDATVHEVAALGVYFIAGTGP